jgi:hypothetical protein
LASWKSARLQDNHHKQTTAHHMAAMIAESYAAVRTGKKVA